MKFLTLLVLMFGLLSCGSDSDSSNNNRKYSYKGVITGQVTQNQFSMSTSQGQHLLLQSSNQNIISQLAQSMQMGQNITVYSSKAAQTTNNNYMFGNTPIFTVESVTNGYGTSNNQGGNNGKKVCGNLTAQAGFFDMTYFLNQYTVYPNSPQAQNFLAGIYPGNSVYTCAYYQTAPQGGTLYATGFGN